jgi:hypothetical protein
MLIKTIVAAMAVALAANAAQPGIRPVQGGRADLAVKAATESGTRYLPLREIQVDLDLPDGASGRGRLSIIYDSSTGFFLHIMYGGRGEASYPGGIDGSDVRVGVATDRLFIVTLARYEFWFFESTDKAASMDDAEAQALAWYGAHLSLFSAGGPVHGMTKVMFSREFFPKGFLPELGAGGGIPVKLVDIVHVTNGDPGGAWDLTLENTDTHAKVKMQYYRVFGLWSTRGAIRAE